METLYEQLGHRRIPGDQQSNKKFDLTLLSTEIRPEETAAQVIIIHSSILKAIHVMIVQSDVSPKKLFRDRFTSDNFIAKQIYYNYSPT